MKYKNNIEKVRAHRQIVEQLYCVEGRTKSYIARLIQVDRKALTKVINNEWQLEQAQVTYLKPSNEKFYNKNKQLIRKYLRQGYTTKRVAEALGAEMSLVRTVILYDKELHELLKNNHNERHNTFAKNRKIKRKKAMDESRLNYNFEDLPGEIWKPYNGGPTRYAISNMGRFKSYIKTHDAWALLTISYNPVVDYNYIFYMKPDGKQKGAKLSRAVAFHFVEGYTEERNTVNHINGIKTDDRACNLEWVSQSENNKHSYDSLGRSIVRTNQHTTGREMIIYKGKYKFKTVTAFSKFIGKSETQTRRYMDEPEKYGIEIIYKKK